MPPLHALAIFAAGIAAGGINTLVGSGTLITFPILLAFGYAPVTANVSNTVGLVPGSVAGAIGYRRELAGQRARALRFATASTAGGIVGAVLLLSLPASAFKDIVPAFIVVALVLIVLQPRLGRALEARRPRAPGTRGRSRWSRCSPPASTGATRRRPGDHAARDPRAVAADEQLQRVNALKVVLAGLVDLVAGIVFIFSAHIAWLPALLIAVGSIIGGIAAARWGRRLPPAALRAVIVVVGITAIVRLV